MQKPFDPNNPATKYPERDYINEKALAEIQFFTEGNELLRKDLEYIFSIGVPHRGKTSLMFECGKALEIEKETLTPFALAAEFMMAAAMNDDDIIDGNELRYGKEPLYKVKGINTAIMVTGYMYALIFSILKKYRPESSNKYFPGYLKAETLITDYFRVMHEAQYLTTTRNFNYHNFTLDDLKNLAYKKASLLFQFCTTAPAYLAGADESNFATFGSLYGITVQFKSDIRDFKFDPKDTDKNKLRLEDYYTGQPNLVLLLTTQSEKLSPQDKKWLIETWSNPKESSNDVQSDKVFDLVKQSGAIDVAVEYMLKIKSELESYIKDLPTDTLKTYLTNLVTGVCFV